MNECSEIEGESSTLGMDVDIAYSDINLNEEIIIKNEVPEDTEVETDTFTRTPIVYTTKLENMKVFKNADQQNPKHFFNKVAAESKPQYKHGILDTHRPPYNKDSYLNMLHTIKVMNSVSKNTTNLKELGKLSQNEPLFKPKLNIPKHKQVVKKNQVLIVIDENSDSENTIKKPELPKKSHSFLDKDRIAGRKNLVLQTICFEEDSGCSKNTDSEVQKAKQISKTDQSCKTKGKLSHKKVSANQILETICLDDEPESSTHIEPETQKNSLTTKHVNTAPEKDKISGKNAKANQVLETISVEEDSDDETLNINRLCDRSKHLLKQCKPLKIVLKDVRNKTFYTYENVPLIKNMYIIMQSYELGIIDYMQVDKKGKAGSYQVIESQIVDDTCAYGYDVLKIEYCCWRKRREILVKIFFKFLDSIAYNLLYHSVHACPADQCNCCCKQIEDSTIVPVDVIDKDPLSLQEESESESDIQIESYDKSLQGEWLKELLNNDFNTLIDKALRYKKFKPCKTKPETNSNVEPKSKETILIINKRTSIVEFYEIAEAGYLLSSKVEDWTSRKNYNFLTDKEKVIVACCWHKRNKELSAMSKSYIIPSAITSMRKRHNCPNSGNCICCCRSEKTMSLTPIMLRDHTSHTKPIIEVEGTSSSYAMNTTDQQTQTGQGYVELEIPENKNEEQPTLAGVDNLVSSILERFKDVRLTINNDGKVAAALKTPVNTLSKAELKVLANILSHAQEQVRNLGLQPGTVLNANRRIPIQTQTQPSTSSVVKPIAMKRVIGKNTATGEDILYSVLTAGSQSHPSKVFPQNTDVNFVDSTFAPAKQNRLIQITPIDTQHLFKTSLHGLINAPPRPFTVIPQKQPMTSQLNGPKVQSSGIASETSQGSILVAALGDNINLPAKRKHNVTGSVKSSRIRVKSPTRLQTSVPSASLLKPSEAPQHVSSTPSGIPFPSPIITHVQSLATPRVSLDNVVLVPQNNPIPPQPLLLIPKATDSSGLVTTITLPPANPNMSNKDDVEEQLEGTLIRIDHIKADEDSILGC